MPQRLLPLQAFIIYPDTKDLPQDVFQIAFLVRAFQPKVKLMLELPGGFFQLREVVVMDFLIRAQSRLVKAVARHLIAAGDLQDGIDKGIDALRVG